MTVSTPERNRTSDLRFRKPLLYPLSYRGGISRDVGASGGQRVIGCRPRHARLVTHPPENASPSLSENLPPTSDGQTAQTAGHRARGDTKGPNRKSIFLFIINRVSIVDLYHILWYRSLYDSLATRAVLGPAPVQPLVGDGRGTGLPSVEEGRFCRVTDLAESPPGTRGCS